MTTYQGGKKRIGKRIHKAILLLETDLYKEPNPYFEPFVGMAGVLRYFGKDKNRNLSACDLNTDLIKMWKAVQRGWKPPLTCSKEEYEKLKNSKRHSAKRAFVGVVASWGGDYFKSYRLHLQPNGKDFMAEGYRGIMDIKPDIMKVKFFDATSYDNFEIENCTTIYCDPPYCGNKLGISNKESLFQNFDYEKFWNKMREWSVNNLVVISEWTAPEDFQKIWEVTSTIGTGRKSKKYNECLYVHNSIYERVSQQTLLNILSIS